MDPQLVSKKVVNLVFSDRKATLLSAKKLHTPSSLVYRFEYAVDGDKKALFVKLPAENIAQTNKVIQRLQNEYHLTKQISSAIKKDPDMGTVSPAGFIRDINALITWEVSGNSLQDLISDRLRFDYRSNLPYLHQLSELSGRWLLRFHSLGLTEDNVDLHKLITDYCGYRLDDLSKNKSSRISESFSNSLKRNISLWIEEALSQPGSRIVLCHNDFSPHNLIVTDKGICVLDFSFSTPGLPAFDLACFWHKLEDLKGSPFRNSKHLKSIQRSFLDAYKSNFDVTRADIKLGLMRLVLSKMLVLLNSPANGYIRRWESRRRYLAYLDLLESDFESLNQ